MHTIIRDSLSALIYLILIPVHAVLELVRGEQQEKKKRRSNSLNSAHNKTNSDEQTNNGELRENNQVENDDKETSEQEHARALNRTLTTEVLLAIKERNLTKRKVLILDLDETLVHSTPIEPFPQFAHLYQYSIDIYIDNTECTFYVSERPHLKHFMRKVCQWFEVVIFTASVRSYADPVIDRLECSNKISGRYFREVSCCEYFRLTL
jgi:TFIIF-interacting CTD phosphatase-like protein